MVLNLREQGYELAENAVLFRNGRDSYELELELNRKKIPFVKYGGQKFTEAAHIKDVLCHVRVLVNPMDEIAWNRVLMLLDGIGPKTARELFQWIQSAEDPYVLYTANTNDRYIKQLNALSMLLRDLNTKAFSMAEMIEHIVSYYKKFCEKRYDDYPKRVKDLEAFVGIAEGYSTAAKMLEEFALDPIEVTAVDTEPTESDEEPLVLSTIHSAKGLEWKNVFIIQVLDGVIPSGYSLGTQEDVEEELRLFYVACTRAKEHLFISYPVTHLSQYGDYFTKPSRFIEALDESLFEPWVLVEEEDEDGQSGGGDPQLPSGRELES